MSEGYKRNGGCISHSVVSFESFGWRKRGGVESFRVIGEFQSKLGKRGKTVAAANGSELGCRDDSDKESKVTDNAKGTSLEKIIIP